MENDIVTADTSNGEVADTQSEATSTETVDVAALQKAKEELEIKNRQLFERAKKAEGFVLKDGHWVKGKTETQAEAPASGDAEDTIALLLEVKGLKEDDEVALFNTWRNDTKRAPRDILNNKIFQAELTALRTDKATQAAIPSSNGRGAGGSSVNVDALVEKFQRTGELPRNFELKGKVLDVIANSIDEKTPPWRR